MDKKKLQEFIDKLQVMATELSEEPNGNTSHKNDSPKQEHESSTKAAVLSENYEDQLKKIIIETPPAKILYRIGEIFDPAGMVVKAKYSSGKEEAITDYSYSPVRPLKPADRYITVSYKGFTVKQEIDVLTGSDHEDKGVFINDFVGDFIKFTKINGKDVEPNAELMEIDVPGGFNVEVDLKGYLAANNLVLDELDGLTLVLVGKVYGFYVKSYICATDSNRRLCDVKCENNAYYIPIKKIYDLTGSANFRLFIENPVQYLDKNSTEYQENYPHEIFSARESGFLHDFGELVSINILSPAEKNSYLIGEKFNPLGLRVIGTYEHGAEREVSFKYSDFSIQATDTFVTISSEQCTAQHPIKVIGQHIDLIVTKFSRTKESSVWGEWTAMPQNGQISVSKNENNEVKTVITFDKSAVQLGNKKRTGLRLYVTCNDIGSQAGESHIKINGVEHVLSVGGKETSLYIGNVKEGDTGRMRVEFEYADKNVKLNLSGEPIVYFCDALDPTIQSEKKDYTLSGNVTVSADLLHGSDTLIFNDIEADSTLLGVGISHVFKPTEGNRYYGTNFRLNLYERLEISKAPDGPVVTPIYTDAVGNKYTFTVIYYIIYEDEKRYLSSDDLKNVTYDSDGNLIIYEYKVYTDYIKVHNFKYLTEPNSTIEKNSRYKEIKAQNDNSAILPVHWIKADNLYKGFNSDGRLVMTMDEYNNYTEIAYDSYGRLTSVKDGKGNYFNLTYASVNMCLQQITSSRGKRIEYGYDENNCLSTVSYFDALKGGENYKNLSFKYAEVTVDAIDTYSICEIACSDNTRTVIDYDQFSTFEHRLSKITNYSSMPDSSGTSLPEQKISSLLFTYDYEELITTISDEDYNEEKYVFTEEGLTKEYYQIYNFLLAKAELYSYTPFERQEKFEVSADLLNKYSYEDYKNCRHLCKDGNYKCGTHSHCGDPACVVPDCPNIKIYGGCQDPTHTACALCPDNCILSYYKNSKTVTELNEYNMPVKVTQDNIYITDTVYKTVVTEYEYDDTLKTVKETSTETYSTGKIYKNVTEYTYNPDTELLTQKTSTVYRVENGIDVKELVSVEEYEYDSYGCMYKTKNYRKEGNSAVIDNVYYTEKTYNSNKQPVEEYDETGKYHTDISYISGTNLVSEVKSPNDHNLYYNYDNEDRVSKMWGTAHSVENANTTVYNCGEIGTLDHSGKNAIEYQYDSKRRPVKITTGGELYESYEYEEDISLGWYFGDAVTVTNANGEQFRAETDSYNNRESAYYNGTLMLQRETDNFGRLWHVIDKLTDAETYIFYDSCGNTTEYRQAKGDVVNKEVYSYDEKGQLSAVTYTGEVNRKDLYTYKGNAVDYVTNITTGDYSVSPTQDIDERYTGKTVNLNGKKIDSESVTYVKEGTHATRMPKQITYPSANISYTYDGNGNITRIMQDGVLQAQYQYDTLGRLIREDNNAFGESYFYSYDNNGNILAKEKWDLTEGGHVLGTGTVTSYNYNKDKLLSFGTESNVYDAIGNPITYRGKVAVWTRGRKLISYNGNTFDYDAQGVRIKKNSIEYYYDSHERLLKQSNGLEFFYDTMGLVGLMYNGESYVYRKDVQGNIIAILDSNGEIVVQYRYDAWGNHKVYNPDGTENADKNFIGNLNPFRYRGYYFDTETGFYYLQTRYYDPEVGRFINMDSIDYVNPEIINGLNLFAYCNNNPVMNVDPEGKWSWKSVLKVVLAVAIVAAVAVVAVATAGTALGVIAAGAAIGAAAGFVVGGTVGAIGAAATGQDIFDGFADGAFTGTIVGGVNGALNAMAPGIGGSSSAVLANVGSIALSSGKAAATVVGGSYLFSKHNPGMSNKPPVSWTNIDEGKEVYQMFGDPDKAAEYLMNQKRGIGNWYRGAGTEFNALRKWFDRIIRLMVK